MYSLGEIEAQCKKAAKGVGLSWGVAEEAGLIARHLSELHLPGPDAIYSSHAARPKSSNRSCPLHS